MESICDKIEHPEYINWEDAMKRDMDFIRTILLKVEELGDPGLSGKQIESLFSDYPLKQIIYHIELLRQSGLIDAGRVINGSDIGWTIYSLTWDGHEFLALAQNNTIWEKVKGVAIDKIGSLGLSFLSKIMLEEGLRLLGVSTR